MSGLFSSPDKPKEPERTLALAEQAAFYLNRYGSTMRGIEDSFIDSTMRRFGDQAYESAAGRAGTQAMEIYEPAIADQQMAMYNRGFDPSSPAARAESEALRAAQARGVGLAQAGAGLDNTDQAFQGLTNVIAQGQGIQTEAMQGNIALAQRSLDRSIAQANQDFMASSSLRNLAGTAAGQVAGYGLYG